MSEYDREAYLAKLKEMSQQELEDELLELMKHPATKEVVRKYLDEHGIAYPDED